MISRTAQGPVEYTAQPAWQQTKLIDNLHVEHRLRRAFFLDGLGDLKKSINLSAGESVWYFLDFEPVRSAISSGRIVFLPYQFQLQGPVTSLE